MKDKDVVVMTPELLLHCLAHGSLKVCGVVLFAVDTKEWCHQWCHWVMVV